MTHTFTTADICDKCGCSAFILYKYNIEACPGMRLIIGTPWKDRVKEVPAYAIDHGKVRRFWAEGMKQATQKMAIQLEERIFNVDPANLYAHPGRFIPVSGQPGKGVDAIDFYASDFGAIQVLSSLGCSSAR